METDINKEWERLWDALDNSALELNNFLSAGLTISSQRQAKAFIKSFDKVKAIAEKLDGAIRTPIEPLKVEMPWQEIEFTALWAYWKDYRLEKFHVKYASREEKKSLQYLKEISQDDCEKAKSYLNFAMAKGYKNFFVPSKNANYTPDLNVTNDDGEKPFNG